MNKAARHLGIVMGCVLVLCMCCDSNAQLGLEWVARYSVNKDGTAFGRALAVDDSGYIYVTGFSSGDDTYYDYATIKYSPAGDTIWTRRYNGPGNGSDRPFDLVLGHGGDVYVTGSSAGSNPRADYATVKYSSNGDTIWTRRYNGPEDGNDWPFAMTADDSGNVYVTGWSEGNGTNDEGATIKYNSAGDTAWLRRSYEALALAVDSVGNLYVAAVGLGGGTESNFITTKYSPTGDTIWVRRYNGPGNRWDTPAAVAVDPTGNVIVTGRSWGVDSDYDYATIKYSPAGDTLWVRRYDGPVDSVDVPMALAVDDSGYVYVAGYSDGMGTGWDYATIKYSPAGDLVWIRRYGSPGYGVDVPAGLAVDESGNVYVTGTSNDAYATLKYSPLGDTIWVRRYNGIGDHRYSAFALALDKDRNIYVTGGSYLGYWNAWDGEYVTIKYSDPTGDVNCDGRLDIADVVLLGNIIDGTSDLSGTCGGGQADVDADGDIDEDDYNLLYDVVASVGP